MTDKQLDELIELLEKPNFELTLDTRDLLALFVEIKELRKLTRMQAKYIEEHLSI